ncbi:MAG: ABC transporter substrate-binding protein [Spirochaetes bacterium]|nr:ABC transporter substrate-binding protein [Spirochaetota bacterium]MBN2771789.1 ABC transporter substrate-binding protein [Spirochaetota bacterium]
MLKFLEYALLIAGLLFFQTGCRQSADSDQPKDISEIVVGFAQIGAESAWRTANTESIISEAKKRNIQLKFSDAQQKQENQIKAFRSFIAQNVDVIGFSPVVESGWGPVLREAKEAGIPVILVDRAVDETDESLWVTVIGSDFILEGERAGKWLIENYQRVKRPDKRMNVVNIVELQGTVGSAPANDRYRGFRNALAGHPNFKIIKTQTGEFTRAKGKEVMEAFLKSDGKKIDVLYSHNDDMALGAIQAIEAYGQRPGKDIIIISIDAVRGAFEAMAAGKLNVTVECSPLLGPQFYDAVEALIRGETIPKRIVTDEGVFPMEVAEKELPNRKY